MRRWMAAVAIVAAAGCGGGGGGGGGGTVGTTSGGATLTATGSLPLSAVNAASVTGGASCQTSGATFGVAFGAVLASDQGGICGYLQRNQDKQNARSIQVAVIRIDPTSPTTTIVPGTYPVVVAPTTETMFSSVAVSQNDAACNPSDVAASSGTVTVTSTAGGRLSGTVNVSLADGGTVTGSFDAPDCAVSFPGDVCSGQIGPQNPSCAP